MKAIRIGTCGWSYDDWKGVFYPEKLPPGDFLGYYAERLDVVEVDSTFYRSPSRKMVEGWRDKTPDGFGFSLKVPQAITHEKVLVDCDKEVAAFLAAVKLLGEKLLCCVLQFGYFNKSAFAGQDEFLKRLEPFLADWPDDVQLAVEVRNKAWMNAKLAELLRNHKTVWVLPDQAWMPPPLELAKKLDVVTGPFGYIRLLGDRAAVDEKTKTLNKIVVDREQHIEADAEVIRQISDRVPVLAFVNNHFAGYAPGTIETLRKRLGL
jgi:uncharacterized protein YecE (DUF72 family)